MVEAAEVLRDCEGREAGDMGIFTIELVLGLDFTGPGARLLAVLVALPIAESRLVGWRPLDLVILRPLSGEVSSRSTGKMSSLSPLKE